MLRDVTGLRVEGDHRILSCADGAEITTRAVVLATGATYRRLGTPRIEALVGAGVFYGGGVTEAPAMAGQHVYVVGAGNSAGQAGVHLARYARRVSMIVRASSLAATMSDYLVKTIEATPNIDVQVHTAVIDGHGVDHLESLVLHDSSTGRTRTVSAAALFILIGAQPHTDWLPRAIERDDKGFIRTGADLLPHSPGESTRTTLPLETSLPGVFAAGDVRHGSVKRVASAVGEGSVNIQSIHQYLFPQ